MTAEAIITQVAGTTLTGVKAGDITVAQNKTNLLFALNLGINQIAQDALLWLGGETITMVADTYSYALASMPVQIVDVYDDTLKVYARNKPAMYGYYQTSPMAIRLNSINAGESLYINYYETPDDYILTDEVEIPNALINALGYFMASKAMEYMKSEFDVTMSNKFYTNYLEAMESFKAQTDSNDVDTLVDTNMIYSKNLV